MHYNFEKNLTYLLKNEMTELYITNALRSFAMSMISIFIPLFLLKNGYTLVDVGIYTIVHYLFAIVACFWGLKFVSKYGVRHAIVTSMPVLILFFLMLRNFDFLSSFGHYTYLISIAIIGSLSAAYYFSGFHVQFSEISTVPIKQLSIIKILASLAGIAGPLIGSIFITDFSFKILFGFIIILLFLAIIPLFFSKERHEPFHFNLKELLKGRGHTNGWVYFSEGITDKATALFWPILLYLMFTSFSKMGWIYFFSTSILLITTYFVGRIKVKQEKLLLSIGTMLHSISLILRSFLSNFIALVGVQSLGGISRAIFSLPFHSIFYKNAKKEGVAYFVFFREFYLNLGRVFTVLLFLGSLLFLSSETALRFGILLGSIAVLIMGKNKVDGS